MVLRSKSSTLTSHTHNVSLCSNFDFLQTLNPKVVPPFYPSTLTNFLSFISFESLLHHSFCLCRGIPLCRRSFHLKELNRTFNFFWRNFCQKKLSSERKPPLWLLSNTVCLNQFALFFFRYAFFTPFICHNLHHTNVHFSFSACKTSNCEDLLSQHVKIDSLNCVVLLGN